MTNRIQIVLDEFHEIYEALEEHNKIFLPENRRVLAAIGLQRNLILKESMTNDIPQEEDEDPNPLQLIAINLAPSVDDPETPAAV